MKKPAVVLACLSSLNLAVALGVWPTVARAQYELCDPLVLIDPGHGGTYLDTLPICDPPYNFGAPCWGGLCHEREVNLAVALRLGEILQSKGCVEGIDYHFTRKNDAKICNRRRAEMAEELGVQQFISIHHDGSADTTTNYTRMIRCNWDTTRSGAPRDSTSALAFKVGFKIRDTFNIAYQDPLVDCGFTVLRNTSMASVISEASFITNPSEARRFVNGNGIDDEAEAIYEGLCSYVTNGGIAIVKNSYSGSGYGNDGTVRVDRRWQESPFVTTWGAPENHTLFVPIERVFPDGCTRTFFRWVWWHDWTDKRDTTLNWFWYEHDIRVTTPTTQHDFHPYLAFYTGGPYTASIFPPADTVWVGDTVDIPWTASSGADSTSAVTIDLDRNGGAEGYNQRVFGRDYFDRYWGHDWVVSGSGTNNAKLRIKADDYAGNSTTAYSAPFVIYDCGQLAVTNEVLTIDKPAITRLDLNYDANKAHKLTLKVYRLDGSAWTLAATPYQGTQFPVGHTAIQWAIDPAHQGQYTTYRMDGACSTSCTGNGALLVDQFSVQVATNENPAILQGPFVEGARTCVGYYVPTAIRLSAYDAEDGASLRYAWAVQRGCLQGMGQSCTTSVPEVSYMASWPAYPPCSHATGRVAGANIDDHDHVDLAVLDAHGGRTNASITFDLASYIFCGPPPPCNCGEHGDVNPPLPSGGDGVVDVFDVIFLIYAVFSEGQQPLWVETCPVNRGDLVPDGVLDVFDVIAMIDYAFSSGPISDPCQGLLAGC